MFTEKISSKFQSLISIFVKIIRLFTLFLISSIALEEDIKLLNVIDPRLNRFKYYLKCMTISTKWIKHFMEKWTVKCITCNCVSIHQYCDKFKVSTGYVHTQGFFFWKKTSFTLEYTYNFIIYCKRVMCHLKCIGIIFHQKNVKKLKCD